MTNAQAALIASAILSASRGRNSSDAAERQAETFLAWLDRTDDNRFKRGLV